MALLDSADELLESVPLARYFLDYERIRGTIELCRGTPAAAATWFNRIAEHARELKVPGTGLASLLQGRVALATGENAAARRHFADALSHSTRRPRRPADRPLLYPVLSGLEEAGESPARVRAAVESWQRQQSDATVALLPCLEPARSGLFPHVAVRAEFAAAVLPPWTWHDPLGDCSSLVADELTLRAANGRDLEQVNLSAPRLLRPAPSCDFAAQTVCGAVSVSQPAIGGLLLWQEKENYLVLELGRWGAADIAFRGCIANRDLYVGRGRLPAEHTWLRLERQGNTVRALCSADGQEWFTAGEVEFPRREGEQLGVHAIGVIDRTIYHGAFPEGTAIRFGSFEMWEAEYC
jgi:hypothetical protein